jgi:enoyl-CoA hydratase/carnithine racemase
VTEELLSTGKIYSADDMLAKGVIDHVVDSGQGEAEAAP